MGQRQEEGGHGGGAGAASGKWVYRGRKGKWFHCGIKQNSRTNTVEKTQVKHFVRFSFPFVRLCLPLVAVVAVVVGV